MSEKVRIEVPAWVANLAYGLMWLAAFFGVYWLAEQIFRV